MIIQQLSIKMNRDTPVILHSLRFISGDVQLGVRSVRLSL